MKETIQILCYGDSNTWGFISGIPFHRYNTKDRWTTILQKKLGKNFDIMVEGLNGRTITSEDPRPNMIGRNGSKYLIPCLDSHDPLDLVIIMLGTTELKEMFNHTVNYVGEEFEQQIIKKILNNKSQYRNTTPKILIIAPPLINETTDFASKLFKGAAVKSKMLGEIYNNIAKRNKCYFLDARTIDTGIDGVHLTKKGNIDLANKIFEKIKTIKL